MKKLFIFLSCINSLLLCMDPPATTNNSERTKAALQLLQNRDLSNYKAIACYDYGSEEIAKALSHKLPNAQLYALDPDARPKQVQLPYVRSSLLARIFNIFWHVTPTETVYEGHDLIFSSFALLFNPVRARAIDSLHVQLKTDGHLIIRGLSALPNDTFNLTITQLAQQKKWKTLLKEFSLNNYEFSFVQAKRVLPSDKWRNISTQAEAVSVTFKNKDALQLWISHWIDEFPFNPPLSVSAKQELAHDFTDEYLKLSDLSYSGANITIEAYKK